MAGNDDLSRLDEILSSDPLTMSDSSDKDLSSLDAILSSPPIPEPRGDGELSPQTVAQPAEADQQLQPDRPIGRAIDSVPGMTPDDMPLTNREKMLERVEIAGAQTAAGLGQWLANTKADPSGVEKTARYVSERRMDAGAILPPLVNYLSDLAVQGWGDIAEAAHPGAREEINDAAAEVHRAATDLLGSKELAYSGSTGEKIGWQVAEAITNMAPMLTVGAITKTRGAPLGIMAMQVGGQAYADAYEKTKDPGLAKEAAIFKSLAEVIPETIPAGVLLRPIGSNWAKRVIDATAGEGAQEALTEFLTTVYDDARLGDMTLSEALRNVDWAAVAEAGGLGALVGGTLAAGIGAGDYLITRKRKEAEGEARAAEEERIKAWEARLKDDIRSGWEAWKAQKEAQARAEGPWWEDPRRRGQDEYREWYEANTGKPWDDGPVGPDAGPSPAGPGPDTGPGPDAGPPPAGPAADPAGEISFDVLQAEENKSAIDDELSAAEQLANASREAAQQPQADSGDAAHGGMYSGDISPTGLDNSTLEPDIDAIERARQFSQREQQEQQERQEQQGQGGDGRQGGDGFQRQPGDEQDVIYQPPPEPETEASARAAKAASESATSPESPVPEPTEAQKSAGNYKKGKIRFSGLDVSIENPAGTIRRPEWPPLAHHYGYIRRTEGADGEQIDAFINARNADEGAPVFVIDQADETGGFDEHKVMLGFNTEDEALRAYHENYSPGSPEPIGVRRFATARQFKDWLTSSESNSIPASAGSPMFSSAMPKEARSALARPAEHKRFIRGSLGSAYLTPDGFIAPKGVARSVSGNTRPDDLGAVIVETKKKSGKSHIYITVRPGRKLTLDQYNAIAEAKKRMPKSVIHYGVKFSNTTRPTEYRRVTLQRLLSRNTYEFDPHRHEPTKAEIARADARAEKAEKARVAASSRMTRNWWKSAPAKGDLITFIRAHGGINTDIESDVRGRLKHLDQQNRAVGLPSIEQRGGKGMTLDDLGVLLAENGYIKRGEIGNGVDKTDVLDLLWRAEDEVVQPEYGDMADEIARERMERELEAQKEEADRLFMEGEKERIELGATEREMYGPSPDEIAQAEADAAAASEYMGDMTTADWAEVIAVLTPEERAILGGSQEREELSRLMMIASGLNEDRMMGILEKDITDAEVIELLRDMIDDESGVPSEKRNRKAKGQKAEDGKAGEEGAENQGDSRPESKEAEGFELTSEESEAQKIRNEELRRDKERSGQGDVPLVQSGDDLFANGGKLEPDLFENDAQQANDIAQISGEVIDADAPVFVFDLYRPKDGVKIVDSDYIKSVVIRDRQTLSEAADVAAREGGVPVLALKIEGASTVTDKAAEVSRIMANKEQGEPVGDRPKRISDIEERVAEAKKRGAQMTKEDMRAVMSMREALFWNPNKPVKAADKAAEQGVLSPEKAAEIIQSWETEIDRMASDGVGNGKTVLSLFDATGEWARPWADAGYDVRKIDLKTDGVDVMDIDRQWLIDHGMDNVDVVLAACPCTDFASSGARDWKDTKSSRVKGGKDDTGVTHKSIDLVNHTLAIIDFLQPSIWAIENPVGRITKITDTPGARYVFDPHHFGDPYTKKTILYGRFNTDLPVANVAPEQGSLMVKLSGSDEDNAGLRSVTPRGFAMAFFMANNHEAYPRWEAAADEYVELLPEKERKKRGGAMRAAFTIGASGKKLSAPLPQPLERAYLDGAGAAEEDWRLSDSVPTEKDAADAMIEIVESGELGEQQSVREAIGERLYASRKKASRRGRNKIGSEVAPVDERIEKISEIVNCEKKT